MYMRYAVKIKQQQKFKGEKGYCASPLSLQLFEKKSFQILIRGKLFGFLY